MYQFRRVTVDYGSVLLPFECETMLPVSSSSSGAKGMLRYRFWSTPLARSKQPGPEELWAYADALLRREAVAHPVRQKRDDLYLLER